MQNLAIENDWIKCIYRSNVNGKNDSIYKFFDYVNDEDTVYIRLDDDIVWLEQNFIKSLLEFRIAHENYFLVFGNIVNNNIIDHIHQRFGAFENIETIEYKCTGNSWKDGNLAKNIHDNFQRSLKEDKLNTYKFNKWELNQYERVSINCISWLGKTFKKYDIKVNRDEEVDLTVNIPKKHQIINCIYGDKMCVHFAFQPQRSVLDKYLDELY